jgi:hypothetical protein
MWEHIVSIRSAFPGIYVTSASVADGVDNYITLIKDQVANFTSVGMRRC